MNCNIIYDESTNTRVCESCGEVFDASMPVDCPVQKEGWVDKSNLLLKDDDTGWNPGHHG